MDNAVALVQAYLRVNGYFTVAEYPVVEAMRNSVWLPPSRLSTFAILWLILIPFPHALW
jgi:hypothetical protein